MIDLDKIESQIDAALAEETQESLTSWLLNKRNKGFSQFLGDGIFTSLESASFSFRPSHDVVIVTDTNKSISDNSTEEVYLFAA